MKMAEQHICSYGGGVVGGKAHYSDLEPTTSQQSFEPQNPALRGRIHKTLLS